MKTKLNGIWKVDSEEGYKDGVKEMSMKAEQYLEFNEYNHNGEAGKVVQE